MSFETSPGADDGGLGGGGDDMRAADRVFLPPLPPGTTAKYKYRLTPSDKYICKHQRNTLDRIREICTCHHHQRRGDQNVLEAFRDIQTLHQAGRQVLWIEVNPTRSV